MSSFQPELRFSIHSKFGMGHSQVDRCAECTSYSPPNEEKKQKMKHLMASQFSITGPSQLQVFSWLLFFSCQEAVGFWKARLSVEEKHGAFQGNRELIGCDVNQLAPWRCFSPPVFVVLDGASSCKLRWPCRKPCIASHLCQELRSWSKADTWFLPFNLHNADFSIDTVLWNHVRRRLHVHDFVIHAYIHRDMHTCIHDYIGMHR